MAKKRIQDIANVAAQETVEYDYARISSIFEDLCLFRYTAEASRQEEYEDVIVSLDFQDLSKFRCTKSKEVLALIVLEIIRSALIQATRTWYHKPDSLPNLLRLFLGLRKDPLPRYCVIQLRHFLLKGSWDVHDAALILNCSALLRELLVIPEDTTIPMHISQALRVVVGLTNSENPSWRPGEAAYRSLHRIRGRMQAAARKSGLPLKEIGIRMGFDADKNPKANAWWLLHKSEDPGLVTLGKFCEAVGIPLTDLLFSE